MNGASHHDCFNICDAIVCDVFLPDDLDTTTHQTRKGQLWSHSHSQSCMLHKTRMGLLLSNVYKSALLCPDLHTIEHACAYDTNSLCTGVSVLVSLTCEADLVSPASCALSSIAYFLVSGLSTHLHLLISELCKIIWFGNSKSKYFCTVFKNKQILQCYALNFDPRLRICPKYTYEFHKLL